VNLEEIDGDFMIDIGSCAVGFTGDFCSTCADDFWRDGYRCNSCADSAVTNFYAALVAMLMFFGSVGLCCALLPLGALTKVVGFIVDAQILSIILSVATPYIDRPKGLVDTLEVLGMILGVFNIEISIFKPGCGFPVLSFTMEVYATLCCLVVVASGFLVMCIFRIPLLRKTRVFTAWFTTRVQPKLPKRPSGSCLCRGKTRSLALKKDMVPPSSSVAPKTTQPPQHSLFSASRDKHSTSPDKYSASADKYSASADKSSASADKSSASADKSSASADKSSASADKSSASADKSSAFIDKRSSVGPDRASSASVVDAPQELSYEPPLPPPPLPPLFPRPSGGSNLTQLKAITATTTNTTTTTIEITPRITPQITPTSTNNDSKLSHGAVSDASIAADWDDGYCP
jgi:transcription factor SPN1